MRSKIFALAVITALSFGVRASALPTLQLDIAGGVFDPATQTTVSSGPVFDLRALFKGTLDTSNTYYISAAITPNPGFSDPAPAFGSVLIDGTSYSPSNFLYGKPPADVMDSDSGNLATHSIYPTYYLELAFNFDSTHTVAAYNVQDDSSASGLLYYHDFSIDVTGLAAGYVLHFDLYDEGVKKGLPVVTDFAPFSHDAESGGRVPDSGTSLMLLGIAVAALGVAGRMVNPAQAVRSLPLQK